MRPRELKGADPPDCISKATGKNPLGIEKSSSMKRATLDRGASVMVVWSSLAPAAPRRSVICEALSESFATATPRRYPAAVGKRNSEAVPAGDEYTEAVPWTTPAEETYS